MKIRTLSLACAMTAVMLSAGCTAVYRNSDACEQMTREKLAAKYPRTLTVSHTGAAIRGERVVVEGQFEALPKAASGVAASGVAAASGTPVVVATGKKKKVYTATAAECTFAGSDLTAFHWLAPADLVDPDDEASE